MKFAPILILAFAYVGIADAAPTVQVNGSAAPITVAVGASITATVAGGPGNPGDWLGVYAVGASSAPTPASWKWLETDTAINAVPAPPGVTSGTVHLVVPGAAGQYQVRFLTNNSYNVVASSPVITVGVPSGVSSVTGARHVTCAPTTGGVVCQDMMARGTPVKGSACNDGDNLYATDHTTTPPTSTFYLCDQTLHWGSVGPFTLAPY
jgi:hypothetical protein